MLYYYFHDLLCHSINFQLGLELTLCVYVSETIRYVKLSRKVGNPTQI